jgi:hypothetical protein
MRRPFQRILAALLLSFVLVGSSGCKDDKPKAELGVPNVPPSSKDQPGGKGVPGGGKGAVTRPGKGP